MFAIGIDVSKSKNTVSIIKDGELFSKPFTFNHSQNGFQIFLDKLQDFDKSEIKIVMESTGIYHLPLLMKLLELDFFVSVENPFLLK